MLKRNISFYKKDLFQKHELCTKGKVHIINFSDEENVDYGWVKGDFFQRW